MKIAYLTPWEQYTTKMSRVRFHQIEAISKVSDLIWTGPGWGNYDDSQSVQANLDHLYNGGSPDLVIVFDHRPMLEFNRIKSPKCVIMNEMHGPDGDRQCALDLIVKQNYDLVICHHLNEMNDPFFRSIRAKCHNLPHCAEATIFKDYGAEKDTDVLLCGNLRFEKYVLRRRFPAIVERLNSVGHKCRIHKHPGGYHPDAYTDRYLVDFAKEINKAKICLTCSSIYKCSFGKYVEIPMCNSLVAGDLPDERQDFFSQFMLVLNDTDSDDVIVEKIDAQLRDREGLASKTKLGYDINHAEFTMQHYAQRFLQIADKFLRKRRLM